MNKLNKIVTILSLAALVSCVLAHVVPEQPEQSEEKGFYEGELESELALFEADEVEAADVNMIVFAEYCYRSRDATEYFLRGEVNGAALKVYNAIFKSIEKISADAIAAGSQKVEQGRQIILDEEAARKIAKEMDEEGAVEPMIIDGDEQVEQRGEEPKSLSWKFFGSIARAFQTFLQLVADETWAQLARVKEELNGENFKVLFQDACSKITNDLVLRLREDFKSAKLELSDVMTEAEDQTKLKSVTFENVNCVTTRRVLLAARLCHGVEKIGPVFFPLLDMFTANRKF